MRLLAFALVISSAVQAQTFLAPIASPGLKAATNEALKDLNVTVEEADGARERSLGASKPLTGPAGDSVFLVEVTAPSPAEVHVVWRSTQRRADIFGDASRTLAKVERRFAARALKTAVREALREARDDNTERIRGTRRFRISVGVNALDGKIRDYISRVLLPCLTNLVDTPRGSTLETHSTPGFVEVSTDYIPSPGEPRDPRAYHASLVREAVAPGPDKTCSLTRSPLESYRVKVSEDAVNDALVLTLTRI